MQIVVTDCELAQCQERRALEALLLSKGLPQDWHARIWDGPMECSRNIEDCTWTFTFHPQEQEP